MNELKRAACVGYFVIIFLATADCGPTRKIVHQFQVPPVNFSLADAVKTDVTYQLFTREITNGTFVTAQTITNLINYEIPTKFLIHGWLSDGTTYWYAPYRDACFKKGNHNIIFIDWSKAGAKQFHVSAANSKPIGKFIGDFIISAKLKLNSIHIIGHSLGAQVAGFIGKRIYEKTGSKLARITCTDPAGPAFEDPQIDETERVDKTDAEFVDVVHTDIGHFGFIEPIGHVDFYPNGGTHQPGCPSYEEDDNCSHARSNWYFIESVNSSKFVAIPCSFWEDAVSGECDATQETIVFGENVPKTAKGVYYFSTNANPPFALS